VAEPRILVVQNGDDDPIGRVGEWLGAAGMAFDVVPGPEVPASPAGYHGLIVLGGAMAATDDARFPWLADVRALLRHAVSDEVPTLGICLGAQLLAVAHGGRVAVNPEGPELGAQLIAKRAAASSDPLFGPLPITPDVIHWHYDAILDLPPGAVQLASSPVSANQAFRLGRLAWGVQFHLETTPEMVRVWAEADAPNLPEYDLDAIVRRAEAIHPDVAEVWQPFVAAFADIVRHPAQVPPLRTVRTSTAEPVTDPAAIRAALAAEVQATRTSLPDPTLRRPSEARPSEGRPSEGRPSEGRPSDG
jgi:GMP synthase-like glutamine amidotransferase